VPEYFTAGHVLVSCARWASGRLGPVREVALESGMTRGALQALLSQLSALDAERSDGSAVAQSEGQRVCVLAVERVRYAKGKAFHAKEPRQRIPKLKWEGDAEETSANIASLKLVSGDFLFYRDCEEDVREAPASGEAKSRGRDQLGAFGPRKEHVLHIN